MHQTGFAQDPQVLGDLRLSEHHTRTNGPDRPRARSQVFHDPEPVRFSESGERRRKHELYIPSKIYICQGKRLPGSPIEHAAPAHIGGEPERPAPATDWILYSYWCTVILVMAPVIVIDASADEPVYAQIARQIRAEIAAGALAPGDVLPSVRTIASDLGVNLNTVARAYRLLEAEGFVAIEEREGARVQPPARRADQAAAETLGEELSVLLARMRQAGLSPAEIRRRVERELMQMRQG